MMRTMLAVAALLLLLSGCAEHRIIPSRDVPHRLSQDTRGHVWVRAQDGTLVEQAIDLPAGWWVAAPEVVE